MISHLTLSPDTKYNILIMGFKWIGNGWKWPVVFPCFFLIFSKFSWCWFLTLDSQIFGTIWPIRDLLLICYWTYLESSIPIVQKRNLLCPNWLKLCVFIKADLTQALGKQFAVVKDKHFPVSKSILNILRPGVLWKKREKTVISRDNLWNLLAMERSGTPAKSKSVQSWICTLQSQGLSKAMCLTGWFFPMLAWSPLSWSSPVCSYSCPLAFRASSYHNCPFTFLKLAWGMAAFRAHENGIIAVPALSVLSPTWSISGELRWPSSGSFLHQQGRDYRLWDKTLILLFLALISLSWDSWKSASRIGSCWWTLTAWSRCSETASLSKACGWKHSRIILCQNRLRYLKFLKGKVRKRMKTGFPITLY